MGVGGGVCLRADSFSQTEASNRASFVFENELPYARGLLAGIFKLLYITVTEVIWCLPGFHRIWDMDF